MVELREWLRQIIEGQASPQLKEMASRGLISFPPKEMLLALSHLAEDADSHICRQALETTTGIPRSLLLGVAGDSGIAEPVIRHLHACFPEDEEIESILATNAATPGDILIELASGPVAAVLEVLSRNQERLRREPEILDALLANAELPAKLKGYLEEERDRQRGPVKVMVEEELSRAELAPEVRFDEVLTKNFEAEDSELPVKKRQEVQESRHKSIYQIIRTLNTAEKLILALKGNREARYLLVRDSNKQVATKVLESPKISDTEVEMIAKMTNVCDEVLRGISMKKEWMGKYNIVKALALNAKTPVGIGLPLINKMSVRDLSLMARNRNIPEVIRQTAARLYRMRRDQRGGGKRDG